MKLLLTIVAAFVVLSAGTAFAGEGDISPGMLADMGLSDMRVMSDTEGLQVRGTGFVFAYGGGYVGNLGDFLGQANSYIQAGNLPVASGNESLTVGFFPLGWAFGGSFAAQ